MSDLADHALKGRFSSSIESLLEGFYRPALMDACRYWRITGYYTSRPFKGVEPGGEGAAALGAELLAWLVGRGHLEIREGLIVVWSNLRKYVVFFGLRNARPHLSEEALS